MSPERGNERRAHPKSYITEGYVEKLRNLVHSDGRLYIRIMIMKTIKTKK